MQYEHKTAEPPAQTPQIPPAPHIDAESRTNTDPLEFMQAKTSMFAALLDLRTYDTKQRWILLLGLFIGIVFQRYILTLF